jgi:hypothetical protein
MSAFVRLSQWGKNAEWVPTDHIIVAERRSEDGLVEVSTVGEGRTDQYPVDGARGATTWEQLRRTGAFVELANVGGYLDEASTLLVNPSHVIKLTPDGHGRGELKIDGGGTFHLRKLGQALAALQAHTLGDNTGSTIT